MLPSSGRPVRHRLETPIQYVKGVGPKLAMLFERKGIRTVEDALYFLPRCYEDRRRVKKIVELKAGQRETGFGEIVLSGMALFAQRRSKVFEAVVGDGSGVVTLKWFRGNERYLFNRFKKGTKLIFSGGVRWFNHQKEIHHPDVEIVLDDIEKDYLNFKRIVPIYSEAEGLHQRTLRRLIRTILDEYLKDLSSPVPPEILDRQKLIDLQEAFQKVHFPPDGESMDALNLHRSEGHRRIIFDELFSIELGLALKKSETAAEKGIAFKAEGRLAQKLLSLLPFQLTRA